MYVFVLVSTFVYVYVFVRVCVCTCTCVCVCAYICVYRICTEVYDRHFLSIQTAHTHLQIDVRTNKEMTHTNQMICVRHV